MPYSIRTRPTCRRFAARASICLALVCLIHSVMQECACAAEESLPLDGRRIGVLRLKNGTTFVGHIDAPSRIQLFIGSGTSWKPQSISVEPAVLVPGASLALSAIDGQDLPQVLTIAVDGQFRQVTTRKVEGVLKTDVTSLAIGEFPAGADFATSRHHQQSSIFAVDRVGQFWEINPLTNKKVLIEGRAELFLPGSHVQTLPEEGNEVFAIDRAGRLVSYLRDPVTAWKGPRLIGAEFVAGSDVTVWRRPDNRQELQVAAINQLGELQVGRIEATGWRVQVAPGWVLPQGSAASIGHTPVNLRFIAVPAKGKIVEMHFENTEWRERPIADGFAWKSNPEIFAQGPAMAAVDVAGNFISGQMADEVWTCQITTTDLSIASLKLAQRTWKRAFSTPFELSMSNTSAEEVTVKVRDRLNPNATRSVQLAPSSIAALQIESELPGEIEEVRQSGTAPDLVSETKLFGTLPQGRYDVEVLANQPRDVFYIETRQKPWPQVPQRGIVLVSKGSFTIPPGEKLRGIQIDLLKSVEMRQLVTIQP